MLNESLSATLAPPRAATPGRPRLLMVTTTHMTIRSFLLPFAEHFRAAGWQVDGAGEGILGCDECRQSLDQVFEVNWSRNPLARDNLTRARRQMREIVVSQAYDIVHVHTPIAAFVTRLALRKLRKQAGGPTVVYTAHGFHFYRGGPRLRNALFTAFEKLAGRWTDHLVTINREDEGAARRLRLVRPDRVHYMPGIGVDTRRYDPANVSDAAVQQVRSEIGLRDGQPLLTMIAGFDPGKRHRDLLLAFARLERRDVHLALLSIGPLEAATRALAAELGVADRVHFPGFRRDVPAWIRASVATILTSEREGLPRSVMESMCLEVPVIGTQIRGLGDLLSDGCGLLFRVGDVADLTAQLTRALDCPEQMREIARRARAKIADYDLQQVIRLHERLYDQVMQERTRVSRA